jgi:hypothetical protein
MGNNPTWGEKAYSMKLTENNKLGEGAYGTVYKILSKDKERVYAAKIFKIPLKMMNSLEKLGYDRELKILKKA